MPKRHRKMKKGGFLGFGESTPTDSSSSMFGSIGDTLSSWGSSISNSASSAWNKTKNAVNTSTSSSTYVPPTDTYTPTTTSSGYMGGRKRSRKMRGGYRDNIAITGLAASASPINDIKTSQPLNIVGGRTKRRHGGKHRHGKSCKHRRH